MRTDVPRGGASGTWYKSFRLHAWALYDFATTPFSALVSTVAFPTFFKEVVAGGAREGDFLWGLTNSLAMAIVVLLAPGLGAYADAVGAKRRLLLIFTLFAVVGTSLLSLLGSGMVPLAMVFFIAAAAGYQGGQVFYNAFLPEMTGPHNRGIVSGYGDALGYFGALIALVLAWPFYARTLGDTLEGVQPLFLMVAGFIILFSLPALLFVKDRGPATDAARISVLGGLSRQLETLRHMRRYRNTFRYLLAFLLYTDAITTMAVFVAIYARDVANLEVQSIVLMFVIAQITASLGSFGLGKLADFIGAKAALGIILGIWMTVLVIGLFARSFAWFLVIGVLAGIGTGAVASVSRSMMSLLAPSDRQGEFFGFYAVAGRAWPSSARSSSAPFPH